jgi:hypothetical protein
MARHVCDSPLVDCWVRAAPLLSHRNCVFCLPITPRRRVGTRRTVCSHFAIVDSHSLFHDTLSPSLSQIDPARIDCREEQKVLGFYSYAVHFTSTDQHLVRRVSEAYGVVDRAHCRDDYHDCSRRIPLQSSRARRDSSIDLVKGTCGDECIQATFFQIITLQTI